MGEYYRVIKGDTRSLDYSSCRSFKVLGVSGLRCFITLRGFRGLRGFRVLGLWGFRFQGFGA